MLRSSNSIPSLCVLLATALLLPGCGAKKKKGVDEEPQPVGWFSEEGWMGQCYNPPEFTALSSGPRRMAWQDTRDALMKQWQGQTDDGVKFQGKVVTNLETALLAEPERIERVAAENLEHCKAAMAGKGAGAWEQWFNALPAKLTEGECTTPPMDYTLFDYLSISTDWHIPVHVCEDDHVRIRSSAADMFKLSDDGPWINVEGDPEQPAGGDLPCNIETCMRGQLIMRFTGDSGTTTILPVGVETTFRAPEHGRIEIMVNDDTYFDNEWKVERGIEHHASIEYSPVE